MSTMNSRIAVASILVLASAAPALARWVPQTPPSSSNAAQSTSPEGHRIVTAAVKARVVTVDIPGRTLTVFHGAVGKAGMSAMTMTIPVTEGWRLKGLHAGDRVVVRVKSTGEATL